MADWIPPPKINTIVGQRRAGYARSVRNRPGLLALLLIPIRTDSPIRRAPRVNQAIILVNVLIYLFVDVLAVRLGLGQDEAIKRHYMIDPQHLRIFQFFTYQFLHGDFWHLFGNMIFLWVFGNGVNSKMGNVAYLMFYLACGVFAGVGFASGSEEPCLGASGAIAGVTTAFLVLFPRSAVTVFYWFWLYVGTLQVQALLLIVLKIILWDNILAPSLQHGGEFVQVAYSAHIAGYIFGFLWCSLMLLIRALPRDQYDIIALIKRYRQRQEYRAMMADPNTRAKAMFGNVARPMTATGEITEQPLSPAESEIVRLRGEIADLLDRHDYIPAAEAYQALITKDPQQCLPRGQMLAVANQLMTMGRYPQAAGAYEKYLVTYPGDSETEEVKLVLGIIYAKYLEQPESAQKHLRDALARLTNPDHIRQATHWLDAATTALGRGPSPAH